MGKNEKRHHKHQHYEIIHRDCGHGARSKVSIVKRESDGKLFIWKQPLFDDKWHHESLRKEIKKAKLWRKFGISKVKASWHPDRRSLLKTYIKGDTLDKILKKTPGFFAKESRPLKALREFVGLLINSKHYIYDLIGENLVFDEKKWHVIDSGSVRDRENRSEVKQEYKKEFLKSWAKELYSEEEIHYLESFLNSVKAIKYIK